MSTPATRLQRSKPSLAARESEAPGDTGDTHVPVSGSLRVTCSEAERTDGRITHPAATLVARYTNLVSTAARIGVEPAVLDQAMVGLTLPSERIKNGLSEMFPNEELWNPVILDARRQPIFRVLTARRVTAGMVTHAVGCSREVLGDVIEGRRVPSDALCAAFSAFLNVKPEALFAGTVQPSIK